MLSFTTAFLPVAKGKWKLPLLKKKRGGGVGWEGGKEMPPREIAKNRTKMAYTSTTEYFLPKLENCGTTHTLPGAKHSAGLQLKILISQLLLLKLK